MYFEHKNTNIKPLGIKMFGIGNIIIGILFFLFFSIYFFFSVFAIWVGDTEPFGKVDWFLQVYIGRFVAITLFVFSFQLIRSGIALLIIDPRARKISKIASIVIAYALLILALTSVIRWFVYHYQTSIRLSIFDLITLLFIIYTFWLNIYFDRSHIRSLFNEQNIKISFIRPILIIIISFLSPFILNYFFPNLFFPAFGLLGFKKH